MKVSSLADITFVIFAHADFLDTALFVVFLVVEDGGD